VAQIPHYTQIGNSPAIVGAGSGSFTCACGQSVLIEGFDPRNFLGIAIRCAVCGNVSETAGLPDGAQPPPNVILVERGVENSPRPMTSDTVLISQEEMERLVAFYQPRATGADPHVISDELLDDVEIQQRNWTNEPLDPSPTGYKSNALAWAVAHFRERLRDPEWTSFADSSDSTAVAVIAGFRDLFASWGHHPLFGAMIATAAAQGYSLHAMAMFGAAKSLTSAGNQIAFVPTSGPGSRIASFQLLLGPQEQMTVVVNRFDRFEWPDGVEATPQAIRAAAIEAMASVQGSINRLRPGMLVLSPGAVEGKADQLFIDNVFAAIGSHGKRYRGLAAVAVIAPKVLPTGRHREVRFGYSFYPIPNRNHAIGQSVRIGSRADHMGVGRS
jgi:hypothetical protein